MNTETLPNTHGQRPRWLWRLVRLLAWAWISICACIAATMLMVWLFNAGIELVIAFGAAVNVLVIYSWLKKPNADDEPRRK